MAGRIILSLLIAFTFSVGAAPSVQAQVQPKSAFGESAVSARYSDAQLSKFIKITARLAAIQATYASQPRFAGSGKYHPSAPDDVLDSKNQQLQDNQYYEMARFIEENGGTVKAYQAMRNDVDRDIVLKKRYRKMSRDMGYKNLDVSKDPFKDAPPHVGTY